MAEDARPPVSPTADAPRALLAGGGSGGHVFPALAVGDELVRRGWRVSFAGNPGGMEARWVAERGVELVPLPARAWIGRGPLARAGALATLARSTWRARRVVRRDGVDAVVATGGYGSVAAALGGAWARRAVVLVEPNARAGAANRWLSRFADVAALAYASAAGDLRCPSFVAGVPIRAGFFVVPALSPAAPPRLLALGGSQGSRRINALLPAAVERALARIPELTVLHQCGPRHLAETEGLWRARGLGAPRVEVAPFVDDVVAAMAAASLVVSRAGAITLAELCAAGRPALLVPLELAGGHQRDNARALEAAGAAVTLDERTLEPDALGDRVAELLADPAALAERGARARALARPGAAAAIADAVVEQASRRRRW